MTNEVKKNEQVFRKFKQNRVCCNNGMHRKMHTLSLIHILKHGHTWKLRKRIYFNTIFTKTKEDSDEKIKA